MTTAAQGGRLPAVASSQPQLVSQSVTLPTVLSETRNVDGFRNPLWGMRALRPGEQVAIQQALVQLEQRQAKAPTKRIAAHVGRLLNHWDGRQSDAEKELVIADWVEDLAGAAEVHIAAACQKWRRTQIHKPKIAEILGLIEIEAMRDRENIRRCRVLLELQPPRPWEHLPKPETATPRAGVPAMLKDLGKRLSRGAMPSAAKAAQKPFDRDQFKASRNQAEVERLATMRKKRE